MTWRTFRAFSQLSLLTALLLLQFILVARAQDSFNVTATPTTAVTFNFVPTPDIGSVGSLSADSEQDIWATSVLSPVSLHFNGSTWGQVPMAKASRVNKVAVISPTNVWAVGQQTTARFSQIQHFNGSTWSVVASPHFAAGEELNSLKVVSASSIFAVGDSFDSLNNRTPLIEHFNGTKWSVVPVPHITGGDLFDIAIISPSDIWAVGGTNSAALTMHFNGVQWNPVPAPIAGLFGVAALSTNNVWAVGTRTVSGAVIEHWNGTAWKVVTSPNTGTHSNLNSISAISPTDIWAVGCTACGDVGGGAPALVEHWNGTAWSINPTPIEFGGVSANTVLAFPSGHIFVGGFSFASFGPTSVIMRGVEGQ
jgi:hypothetical protein